MNARAFPVSRVLVAITLVAATCTSRAGERPELPADFQRGVNHAHIHARGHGYGSVVSAAELAALKKIGVNWIAITPFGYQDGAEADVIVGYPGREVPSEFFERSDSTLTDADLAAEIASAHKLGIRVTLKPQIWSNDFWDGHEWHGSVRQTSPAAHAHWWTCYREFALHYARVAERAGADQYCIGTELVEMTTRHPKEWRDLIAEIRKVYHGPLTYCAHCGRELDAIDWWDALDFIGVSAYFPLAAPDGAGVEELVAAWQPHRRRMEQIAARFHKPVLFLEAGYRPVVGAHREPWVYAGGNPDPEEQVRDYEALFRAMAGAAWWKGMYFWKTFTDPRRASARGDGTDYSFRGRPAEDVVRRWYGGSSPN